MAKLERTYNIPLRKEFQKAPSYKKAKKAIKALKEFLARHMKSDNVKLGRNLNLKIWEKGIKNPPHHVKVTATKDDDNIVRAELFGFKYDEITKADIEKMRAEEEKAAQAASEEKEPKAKKAKSDDKDLVAEMDKVVKGESKKPSKKEEKAPEEKAAKPAKEASKEEPKKKASPKKKSEKSE